jgi:pentatricopeptide repeat protein
MTDLPKLTENDIRSLTDAGSFGRGMEYYRHGYILRPRRQGMMLKAQCLGSQPTPYRVQVTLNDRGIVAATCSCPVGYACKHTVALLLTWVHKPDAFTEEETLDATLEKRDKAELIALIKKMLDHVPELEDLLQIQALGEIAPTQQLPPEAIIRQVEQAMNSGRGEWGESYEIARTLGEIVGIGASYAAREDWSNAAVVYGAAAQAILDNYESVYDDEGETLVPVGDCISGLGECLEHIEDEDTREGILRALLDVYTWDVNFGGVGVGDEIPAIFDEQATPDEKQVVADWVRELLPAASANRDDFSRNWRRERYGGLLLDLEADTLDDEAFLRVCRETGRIHDLVERLLELNRIEEAMQVAQNGSDYDLLSLADRFVTHSQDDVILHLIRKRAVTSQDHRLKVWLRDYAQAHHRPEEALILTEELFWGRPSLELYQELQKLASPLQQWNALRARTLARLGQETRNNLLVECYLSENEVELAIQVFKQMEKNKTDTWGTYDSSMPLRIRVAQAAEKDFPWDAIDFYMRSVFSLIDMRGRGSYITAAQYLLRVRELFERVGDPGRFTSILQNLRDANKRLRALKEELDKVGL